MPCTYNTYIIHNIYIFLYLHHRSLGQYIHPKMFRIAFIISSPPSSPPLPDYYILIIIEWTISPEITLTVYVVENLKIQISEENILERTFTQQFLSQIPRREVIVFSLNYLVSCNLLQQRRLLTSS